MVTENGSLTPICSLSKRSLSPSLTVCISLKKNFGTPSILNYCFSGWGLTTGGGLFPPNTLQTVDIDILNQEECNELFQGYIKPGMICAGKAGSAPCNGDSGGPLVCPDGNGNTKLAGIVSFGQNGCTSSGVYTRVSEYEEWISERIVA